MDKPIDDPWMAHGGPAFPTVDLGERTSAICYKGMSLRDYFAAKAMHAELNTAGAFKGPALALAEEAQQQGRSIEAQIAFNAYLVADAMLSERAKP